MISSIRPSTRASTSGSKVRMLPDIITSSGMMLPRLPPSNRPMVTTASSCEATFRLTTVCSAVTAGVHRLPLAGEGQAGLLLQRQAVDVGAPEQVRARLRATRERRHARLRHRAHVLQTERAQPLEDRGLGIR